MALSRGARQSEVDEVAAIPGFNAGVVLGELDRSEEAIAVYDEVVARFGDAAEPAAREAAERAGIACDELKRST